MFIIKNILSFFVSFVLVPTYRFPFTLVYLTIKAPIAKTTIPWCYNYHRKSTLWATSELNFLNHIPCYTLISLKPILYLLPFRLFSIVSISFDYPLGYSLISVVILFIPVTTLSNLYIPG